MEYRKIYQQMYPLLKFLKRNERWSNYNPRFNGGGGELMGKYIVEIVDEGEYEMIFLLSSKRPCIAIDHDKSNNYAALNTVHYDQSCTVDGKMKRGSGTKEMVNFALDLLKKRGVKKVQLSDNSKIVCNGTEVDLKLMYFFKYGETWYEKNFGFKAESKYQEKYEEVKNRRLEKLDIEVLKNAPCEEFTNELLDLLIDETKFSFYGGIAWEKIL
jgi:hypothetical protein